VLKPALGLIRGMAHITGGGFEENLPRMLGDKLGARLDTRAWPRPPIFDLIQRAGSIETSEMYRVFNMGLGMVVAVAPAEAEALRRAMPAALAVGDIVALGEAQQPVQWR
jgi:phosphoribosylformylglycinamidine cyclo-ligase